MESNRYAAEFLGAQPLAIDLRWLRCQAVKVATGCIKLLDQVESCRCISGCACKAHARA